MVIKSEIIDNESIDTDIVSNMSKISIISNLHKSISNISNTSKSNTSKSMSDIDKDTSNTNKDKRITIKLIESLRKKDRMFGFFCSICGKLVSFPLCKESKFDRLAMGIYQSKISKNPKLCYKCQDEYDKLVKKKVIKKK